MRTWVTVRVGNGTANATPAQAARYTIAHVRANAAIARGMVEDFPKIMSTGNIGHMPNNALFHAEANALLRAADMNGGPLVGRVIEIRADRRLCFSCEFVLPSLGTRIGNPTVSIIDGVGDLWIMRDGIWIRRGRP